MPNSTRPKLPTFQVVPDSSVLHSEKPFELVSPGFEKLWDELSKLANLQLFIPDVVVGERMFQMLWVARDSLKNAQKSHSTINSIWGNELPKLPSEDEIQKGANLLENPITNNLESVLAEPRIQVKSSIYEVSTFMLFAKIFTGYDFEGGIGQA